VTSGDDDAGDDDAGDDEVVPRSVTTDAEAAEVESVPAVPAAGASLTEPHAAETMPQAMPIGRCRRANGSCTGLRGRKLDRSISGHPFFQRDRLADCRNNPIDFDGSPE
jgi:hypothetical protein